MTAHRWFGFAASIAFVGASCGSDDDTDGETTPFEWYATCGDPSCQVPDPDDPNVTNCTDQAAGQPCDTIDESCEPTGDTCGAVLLCTDEDPTHSGNCPRSLAAYKRDIHYADDAELARTHDELMRFRLARWRYKTEAAGAREHLGFLIDDVPDSAAVASDGGHVDVYGYASMTVAALQVQAKRIDALEREVKALREELAKK